MCSSGIFLFLHQNLVFYTMVCSLSFLTTSRVPQQDSDLSTRLPSAQHGHHSLQWPSGSPEQMLCTVWISCVKTSHLPCIRKRILDMLWRFLIPCPVQAFLLGKSQPGLWETLLLAFQVLAEGKIDTTRPVHSIPSCMSILRWVFTLQNIIFPLLVGFLGVWICICLPENPSLAYTAPHTDQTTLSIWLLLMLVYSSTNL